MNENLRKLREPFPANQISKLPKPSKAQTEALKANFKLGQRCTLCGGWHQPEVVHLDYVGHAALTDRLLDTDPAWSWEPFAISDDGLPVIDNLGGMWIRLTVCGITRIGYGDAQGKDGPNAIKECIGDALRNAAMRFGAALDLWHKGDLHGETEPEPIIGMSPSNLADWINAIEQAAPNEIEHTVRDGLAAAQEVKDREAWVAIRAAGKKREAVPA